MAYQIPHPAYFRRPTAFEQRQIAACIEGRNSANIRRCGISSTLFCVLGLVFCGFRGTDASVGTVGFSIALGIVFFAIAFVLMKSRVDFKRETKLFKNGNFVVLDGFLSDIEYHEGSHGCRSVVFNTSFGVKVGRYRVRCEELCESTRLLLAFSTSKDMKSRRGYVFTPFMMRDEAFKLHW